ncbi:hypothetical protein X798_07201 [Onchocerca flexuosa]|uniref:Uncharacterized protein n=1 Tax=Onchocerca flexuosa TaxID=387005 RepID=A0A238BMI4_9BILA|nr:hypothetical protein X798_07201 [Onchocerca flexuosa]
MKKCRSAKFNVIMDHKNTSQETSKIVEKLESKIESIQKIFNNTRNRIEMESIRDRKLKITYKMVAEYPIDNDKVRMSPFARYVQKRL